MSPDWIPVPNKPWKRTAAVALLLIVGLGTACGGESPSESKSTAGNAPIDPPTLEEMSERLAWAMDEHVPNTEKQDLVQGSVADPQLVDHVLDSYRQEGARIEVKSVTPVDSERVVVAADLFVGDTVHPQMVPFVAEAGLWKVEQGYACGIVELLQLSSPAC